MDHPESQGAGVLETLKLSVNDSDELIDILPSLEICFVSEEQERYLPELISTLLGPAVQALSLQQLELAILQPFMPLIKQFISKTFKAISDSLTHNDSEETIIPEIKQHLESCTQVLLDLDSLLRYINNVNNLSVFDVFSLPKNVTDIVGEVFFHCQKSKEDYKDIFSIMHKDLANLFQNCHKVHNNLMFLLKDKLSFDCSSQEELQLLIGVLDVLSWMGGVVVNLDTMTLVAHWKAYAWLTQTYVAELRSRHDISGSVNCLAVNICAQLSSLKSLTSDTKSLNRSVKVSGLLVKVLIKLCENYQGYIQEGHKELLNCLISLSGHTSQLLSGWGLPADQVSLTATQVLAGVAPLLSHIILDPLFIRHFNGFTVELSASSCLVQTGCCNLLVLVLRKLIQLSTKEDEVKELWLKPSLPLIETVFKVLQKCSASLSAGEDDIYRSLLSASAAFTVATCSCNMFTNWERIIMENLLQPLLFPALFSSDLMCLIARFGSSELCLQWANVLSEMLLSWPAWDRQRPEWVYVSWSLSRLVSLLSNNHLQTFRSQFPSQAILVKNLSTFLNSPVSENSVSNFELITERLSLFGVMFGADCDPALTGPVYQLWQHVAALPVSQSHWAWSLYSALSAPTCLLVNLLSNTHIAFILGVLMKASKENITLVSFVACEFLQALAKKIFINDSSETSLCRRISSLFRQLLESENPLSSQLALETFSYFAHVTKYEQIVPEAVVNSDELETLIKDYFEQVPVAHSGSSYLEHLQSLQSVFEHKCKVKQKVLRTEVDMVELNPCKKMKPSLDEKLVCDALDKFEKDLVLLEEYKSCEAFSQPVLFKVQSIIERLEQLAK